MAEFFEKFTKKVTNVASNVKTKAKDTYDITVLKLNLRSKEADLDNCFEKLGRAYYISVNKGTNNDKIKSLLLEADNLSKEIIDLKSKIATAQNKRVCEHCFSLLDNDASYCQGCGQKIVIIDKSNAFDDESEVEVEIINDPETDAE
jgi:RNA polymerase subunit RPABC4/transcription elongation factor Spt4